VSTEVACAGAATRKSILAAAFLCGFSLCGFSPGVYGADREIGRPASSPPSPTLARILAVWKARQERVKTFHFCWDSRITVPKGYSFPDAPVLGGLKADGVEIDRDNVQYTIPQSELWVEGNDRFRDELLMVQCSGPSDWKQIARIRYTIDGTRHSRLNTLLGSGEPPRVTLWNKVSVKTPSRWGMSGENFQWDARNVDLTPLMLTLRPLLPTFGWSAERCRVVSENSIVDNVHCIKIQMEETRRSEACWVDPSRDDAIILWERRTPFAPAISISIEYQRDKDYGWVPSRWKRRLAGNTSTAAGNFEASVTRYTINEQFPSDTFGRVYPPGTRVFDATADGPTFADDTRKSVKGREQDVASIDAIAAAWSKRQARIKTFKFTWHKELLVQNPQPDFLLMKGRPTPRRGAVANRPDYIALTGTDSVCVDGDRFAFSDDIDGPTRTSMVLHRKASFDGAVTRTYSATPGRNGNTGIASIRSGFDTFEPETPTVKPLMHAFRPLDPNLGRIKLSQYRVSPIRGKIGEISCAILESVDETRPRYFYWLDPARDYIVLREHESLNGQDASRTDIAYRSDPTFGWIPSGWNETILGASGDLMESLTANVSEFAINQPIPASAFQIEFPGGTQIDDSQNKRRTKRRVPTPKPAGSTDKP
jgi:hypothetical protein